MKKYFAAVALALALAAPARAQTVADEGQAVVDAWIAEFTDGDIAGVVGLYLPEALVWVTSGRTLSTGTEAFTTYFTNVFGAGDYTATLLEHSVLAVSDTVVVSAGRIDVLNVGTGAVSNFRYHFVLVEGPDGVWQIAAHHSSRLPDPPAAPAAAPATPAAAPATPAR
ncbi:MAG: nuclear transport factor 2 family protein [Bauldia sp.]|nr:nuclear transport factor 2 family protein [Bauldia sp.]